MQPYEDKDITCKDCGTVFVHRAEDQEFFANKGYTEPKRCRECVQKKKAKFADKN